MDSRWSTIINTIRKECGFSGQMEYRHYIFLGDKKKLHYFKQSTWLIGLAACRTWALHASGQDIDISNTVKVFYSFHHNNSASEWLWIVYRHSCLNLLEILAGHEPV